MFKKDEVIKVCIPSVGENLEAEVDSRFGRAGNFILAEVKDGEILGFKSVRNTGAEQRGGAGVSAVEQIGELGADILITKEVGPKAKEILDQLDIKVVKDSGIVKDVLERYVESLKD